MGEFTNGMSGGIQTVTFASQDKQPEQKAPEQGAEGAPEQGAEVQQDQEPVGFDTDVSDVRADDLIKQGKDEFPCFDVDDNEFYQNMQSGRRRLRFKSGSAAQKYMKGTKYNRPFYIRTKDAKGKHLVRKIK